MGKLNPVGKLLALDVLPDLPALFSKYPDGLTIKAIQQELEMEYNDAYQAFTWLGTLGCARHLMRPDRNVTMLVPLDWQAPTWGLTEKQRAVLEWLSARADAEGYVTASMRQICDGALQSRGGIVAHLDALDKKGYLRFIDRGNSVRAATYRVFPSGDATGRSVWPGNRPAMNFDEWRASLSDRDRDPEGDETRSGSVERSEIEPGPKASPNSPRTPPSRREDRWTRHNCSRHSAGSTSRTLSRGCF